MIIQQDNNDSNLSDALISREKKLLPCLVSHDV